MVIEIAGVPVRITGVDPQYEGFFDDYLSDRPPDFELCPTQADMDRVKEDLDQMFIARGSRPPTWYNEGFLQNNAIHALLAERLIDYGVLLMHGSALCMDGQAYIFTAKSGVGKSTHARLWREAFGDRVWMINDDKPMLRVGDHSVLVYGTPWNGKHRLGRNACAPLKAVIGLSRAEDNSIRPASSIEGFQLLVKYAYSPRDPAAMKKVLALEQQIVRLAEFYTLQCNLEPGAALTAWQGMNAG